ncbi:MAG TPA: tRNA (adenosine(37)-N6)-threonylcarbamoyltransferase complex dimerization subunit type 1 TsaB [Thermoanaerobaculia bacterium]|nr:tRNA (adenosine(37)-N6)-threonylcarbamoyltransferase complex dimerization subunit type 1 TsaB [Thermoanaerobaculia bacterium]
MTAPGPILAVDSASPVVSVAVAVGGAVRAERAVEIGRSSERLLAMIDEVLREAGVDGPRGLAGIVALAGPGSFTGLRVGLATVLGLHQATGVPAAAVPTLPVLAAAVPAAPDE